MSHVVRRRSVGAMGAAALSYAAPYLARAATRAAGKVVRTTMRRISRTGSMPGKKTGSVPERGGRKRQRGGRIISGNDQPLGINSTSKTIVIRDRKKNLIQKGAGKWFYVTNYSGFSISQPGQQQLNELFYLSTNSQHTVATGNGFGVQNTYHALSNLNPNRHTTGSGMWASGANWSNTRYVLLTAEINLDFSNMSNGNIMFDVYVHHCVKNHNSGLTTAVDAAFLTQGNNVAAIVAPTVAATDTAGSLSMRIVGTQLKDCKNLKATWKLLSTKYVNLAGAASENMTYKIQFNRVIDTAKITAVADLFQSYIDTLVVSVLQRGSVGTDSVNAGNATYCASKLAWVANVKYQMCAVKAGIDHTNVGFAASQVTNNTVNIASQAITGTVPIVV